jgi:hypothetical protein
MKGFLYIALKADLATIPAPAVGTHAITADITMEATKTFFKWDISKVKSKNPWAVVHEGDSDASSDVTTFQCVIAGTDKLKSFILGGNPACEYIVIVEDKNGKRRLVGDLTEGCTVKVGETINDTANQYDVEIMWDAANKPYFYEGLIPS